MEMTLLVLILGLLIYLCRQVSRCADRNSLRGRLDHIEGKLDYILLMERGDDGVDSKLTESRRQ